MNNIIYKFTGNPFVDAGIWAICQWSEKRKPEDLDKEDLRKIIEDVVPLYLTDKWNSSTLHGMIFPNHGKISNPGLKRYSYNERKNKALDYFNNLIEDSSPLGNSGNCTACGRRDTKQRITKSEVPLTGSKHLINFFSFGTDGADYCPACVFAIQFSPLVLYQCGKLLLVHSNSDKIMYSWSKKAIHNIQEQMLTKSYTGCFNEDFTNARNALFHIIQDIILDYDTNWLDEKPSINLYHFTNYNQPNPECLSIYHVPTSVFRFLAYVKQYEKYNDWKKIVKKGYHTKKGYKVNWEKFKDVDVYRKFENYVYNNLLENKSIIRYFFNRKNREVIGDWILFTFYLKEVRKMDNKRLETLKRVGDDLSEYIKLTDNTKRMVGLETAKNYNSFRNVLRKIIKDRIKSNAEKPLFSLEEYIEDMFPDGNLGWRETQDLLLFRIYENLHDWMMSKELPEDDEESNDKN